MPANEIIDGIYLGDLDDARVWNGNKICVLESFPQGYEPKDSLLIPILTQPHNHLEEVDAEVIFSNLDLVSHVIQNHINTNEKLLVHCAGGMERSPLALTWYMHNRRGLSLEDAFKYVKEKRPQAMNRLQWLNSTSK